MNSTREIILVVSDEKGKNILFILDNLQSLTLEEAIKKTEKGEISGVHVVEATEGVYLRSSPNTTKEDNLDSISIPFSALTEISQKEASAAARKYRQKRQQLLMKKEAQREKVVYINGRRKGTEREVIEHLSKYRNTILVASKHFEIDPNILGAILIDEYVRLDIIDKFDWLVELNTSVGVAQVKIETARGLIKNGYYNPNPKDKNLSKENISKVSRRYLKKYVENPEHSIYFAAAEIKRIIDEWTKFIDLSERPEIIGTIYSLEKKKVRRPHANPQANDRGKQIKNEFYSIAKGVLKP